MRHLVFLRVDVAAQAQMERHKQQQRQQQLARAQQHASRPAALLHKLWLRGSNTATDHLRSVLILSVFGFKVGLGMGRAATCRQPCAASRGQLWAAATDAGCASANLHSMPHHPCAHIMHTRCLLYA